MYILYFLKASMLETFEQICLCIDYVMLINMLFYLWKDVGLSCYCEIKIFNQLIKKKKDTDVL